MGEHYILDADGKTPVLCDNLIQWSKFFGNYEARRVDATELHDGKVLVSTVFLGVDHDYGEVVPLLWETMIFGGEHDLYRERYARHDSAIAGHAAAVLLAQRGAP